MDVLSLYAVRCLVKKGLDIKKVANLEQLAQGELVTACIIEKSVCLVTRWDQVISCTQLRGVSIRLQLNLHSATCLLMSFIALALSAVWPMWDGLTYLCALDKTRSYDLCKLREFFTLIIGEKHLEWLLVNSIWLVKLVQQFVWPWVFQTWLTARSYSHAQNIDQALISYVAITKLEVWTYRCNPWHSREGCRAWSTDYMLLARYAPRI